MELLGEQTGCKECQGSYVAVFAALAERDPNVGVPSVGEAQDEILTEFDLRDLTRGLQTNSRMGVRRVSSSRNGFGITTKIGLFPAWRGTGRRWRPAQVAKGHERGRNEVKPWPRPGGLSPQPAK